MIDKEYSQRLIDAVNFISRGDINGPTGLEALGMSISGVGEPGRENLCDALRDGLDGISSAIFAHSQSIDNLANAISGICNVGKSIQPEVTRNHEAGGEDES
jgi:hypothetical protein